MHFDPSLLPFLCCPECQSDLKLSSGAEGELHCTACSFKAPIVGGIPRCVSADNYAQSFGFQWNKHSATQLDSHIGLPISRDRIGEASGWPSDLRGQVVLEAGSGAGRFTEVLVQSGAKVVSFDFSKAVEANARNNGSASNLTLMQANILRMPFKPKVFDKVMCLGVIQHTPDPAGAFDSLARRVKPGGQLVIDVYEKRFISVLHWRYLLRPITKRMDKHKLYEIVARATPPMVPLAGALRRAFGRTGARVLPISEFAHLGLPPDINRDWEVFRGSNGVIGRGTAP
jgi:SAM-dependent methyltransferase